MNKERNSNFFWLREESPNVAKMYPPMKDPIEKEDWGKLVTKELEHYRSHWDMID